MSTFQERKLHVHVHVGTSTYLIKKLFRPQKNFEFLLTTRKRIKFYQKVEIDFYKLQKIRNTYYSI